MTRSEWFSIPEIDDEMIFNSDPAVGGYGGFHARFQFDEARTYDLLNVMLKVSVDPNVMELYKMFLNKEETPCPDKAKRLVNNLMERYNPDLENK